MQLITDNKIKLMVLAGGFGTRLSSVLFDLPKVLAPVGNFPFLILQIQNWKKQGINSFIFLLHFKSELIIDVLKTEKNSGVLRNCELEFVIEPEPMGTGGAVAYAIQYLNLQGNFLLANGDTWLGNGIQNISISKIPSISVVKISNTSRYGLIEFDSNSLITSFQEKCDVKFNIGWIYAGMSHLHTSYFNNWNQQFFSLEKGLFQLLINNKELSAVELQTDFIDIGIPEDYFFFCNWFKSDNNKS